MPNQRQTGKKLVGFWLDQEEREKLARIAIKMGVDRTELIRLILTESDLLGSGLTKKHTDASWLPHSKTTGP